MNEQSSTQSERRGCGSCLMIGIIAPVVLLILLIMIFANNNRVPSINLPARKMPKVNGWNDFIKAGKLVGKIQHFGPYSDPKGPGHWTRADYESFLSDNAVAFAAFRDGLNKPCACPLAYTSTDFNDFALCRELARTIIGEAKYYEIIGQYRKSVDSNLDCVEFGVMMPRGGTLIAGLVGVAVEAIGMDECDPIIAKLNENDLSHVAQRIERIQKKRAPFGEFVLEEGRMGSYDFVQILKSKDWAKGVWSYTGMVNPSGASSSPLVEYWKQTRFALANKTAMMNENQRYYKAFAAEQRGPYTGKSSVPVPNNAIAQACAYLLPRARCVFTHKEAVLIILQVEVALRRYQLANGSYPADLKALVPRYLKHIPADPFGGKPLHYKPLNGGKSFSLYSIGQNFTDDGGTPPPKNSGPAQGDIVAGKL